jgi:hypothetical protein
MPSKWGTPLQGTIDLIEIDDAEHKIYFATRGLSFHRRLGANMLVTALPIRPTGRSQSHFSIGMDWPRAWETAIDRTCEPWILPPVDLAMGSGQSGSPAVGSRAAAVDSGAWLAQCNSPNVRFTVIDPGPPMVVSTGRIGLLDGSRTNEGEGAVNSEENQADNAGETENTVPADACFWLVETAGRSGTAKLSCLKNIVGGWRVDYRGYECDKLRAEAGELLVPYKAWERTRIAVIFGD